MRTEKELWQVVLDHPELFGTGLCAWIWRLEYRNIINKNESCCLTSPLNEEADILGTLYWIGPIGEIQPRIDWIKKRMEEL